MKLQYIASACVLVEHQGVRVLCDPWLTDGIYGGAWYHNPPLTVTPEDFHDVEYCYVSHIHPDHADLATIARLNKRTVFLLGSYAEAFLAAKIRAMGFQVLELPHDQPFELATGFSLQIIPADDCNPQACGKWIGCEIKNPKDRASYQIDTLAVFRADGQVIVNVNDCPYELAKGALDRVRDAYGQPDLLCVGYAGAGPWPQCFVMPEAEKRAAADAKTQQFIAQMRQFVDHLHQQAYLPFAGQYTLGGSLVGLNDFRGVPELDELPDDPRMVRLPRNGWIDLASGEISEPWMPTPKPSRESLWAKVLDHESDEWPSESELCQLTMEAERAWWGRCVARGYRPSAPVGFTTSLPCRLIRWQLKCEVDVTRLEDRSVEIDIDARLLKRILTRQFNFNNAEVGSLLTFTRIGPYDRGLMNSLSYLHV